MIENDIVLVGGHSSSYFFKNKQDRNLIRQKYDILASLNLIKLALDLKLPVIHE